MQSCVRCDLTRVEENCGDAMFLLHRESRIDIVAPDKMDAQISAGAQAIARELVVPVGQIALDKVVRHHLPFFDLAQTRGLTWRQIAAVLHAAGAHREGGTPFAPGHLSAVVWRQRDRANGSGDKGDGRGRACLTEDRTDLRRGKALQSGAPPHERAGTEKARTQKSRLGKNVRGPVQQAPVVTDRIETSSRAAPAGKASSNADHSRRVNTAMKRAANLLRDREGSR